MRRLKRKAGYDFSYDNLNKILDAMNWTGSSEETHVSFTGTIPVETLKTFGLTDEDLTALPNAVKDGEIDFEDLTDSLFKDYVGYHDRDYELANKDITVNVQGTEFYIEGTADIEFESDEDMNGPDEFNQNDFI